MQHGNNTGSENGLQRPRSGTSRLCRDIGRWQVSAPTSGRDLTGEKIIAKHGLPCLLSFCCMRCFPRSQIYVVCDTSTYPSPYSWAAKVMRNDRVTLDKHPIRQCDALVERGPHRTDGSLAFSRWTGVNGTSLRFPSLEDCVPDPRVQLGARCFTCYIAAGQSKRKWLHYMWRDSPTSFETPSS